MKLYGYFRSSAAYRVRIAFNLKELVFDPVCVQLRQGEHHTPGYDALNPLHLVPTLVDGPEVLVQSLAIVEYLDEIHPMPPLLPADSPGRARVRGLALTVACDIHPLNNVRVLNYLTGPLGVTEADKEAWYRHWIADGFTALERMLSRSAATGRFCHGDTPTLADICLVPQVYNAERYDCELSAYPTIRRIVASCAALPAFAAAHPDRQPDAEP